MYVTLYYVKKWTEGVWSGRERGKNCVIAHPFHSREECQVFIDQHFITWMQKRYIEPMIIHVEIVTKQHYVPMKAK